MANVYSTTDIVLAATLRCLGFKLANIVKNGNKGTFQFEGVDEDVLNKYDLGELRVEPSEFNHNIKALTTASRR